MESVDFIGLLVTFISVFSSIDLGYNYKLKIRKIWPKALINRDNHRFKKGKTTIVKS